MYVEFSMLSKNEPGARREDSISLDGKPSTASLTSAGGSRRVTTAPGGARGTSSREGGVGGVVDNNRGVVEETTEEEVLPCILSLDVVMTEDYLDKPATAEGGKDGQSRGNTPVGGEGVVVISRGKSGAADSQWEEGEDGGLGGGGGAFKFDIVDFNSSIETAPEED